MSQNVWMYGTMLVAALVLGWAFPALVMRAFWPSLKERAPRVVNYRALEVPTGLGLVWAFWAAGIAAVAVISGFTAQLLSQSMPEGPPFALDRLLTLLSQPPAPALIAVVLFGLVDDVFPGEAEKGFRGHVAAMFAGRLTTGGVKVLGIGTMVLLGAGGVAAMSVAPEAPAWQLATRFVVAALVMALSANFVNLLDLRPGRALKFYSLAAVPAAAGFSWAYMGYGLYAGSGEFGAGDWLDAAVSIASLLVLVLGPAAVVWGRDLSEQGMLGDAGANAAGFLLGYLVAGALPLPWLTAAAVALLALNLLSEKVSFSALIEKVGFLKWLDGLGRLRQEEIPETSEAG